ncbi:t(6)A37 threonylcarbamoyladenosine biosynthesis protein RimN [Luteitalea pratensis]|uniref:Threonylcarbamoyl-AMP synthase n=1 Tax=Luteitalea pratensis TaxID=1855912 RepID=A0A143PRS7_LUTPR|nr:L-threonylcarbamoyladenylate synthase [Luteitalea pratensis]AMY10883.1 t(6)A37 threonylcarbamoyladenosine biosynthesis protein RimN [Luteitalea pratensis]
MVGPDEIAAAVAALQAGDVIGLPTETVYGLAGDASNPVAVARIFAIKGRPSSHPVIVHLPDVAQVPRWARETPAAATALMQRFWPGPLTIVLPRRASVSAAVTGGQDTVALRVPAHPVARQVLDAFGGGLAAPSANRYGRISPTTAAHVRADLGNEVRIVLDGGPSEVGLESTIVACIGQQISILRPGRVGAEAIEAVVGPVSGASPVAPRVPGSVASHYAPHTPLEIVEAVALDDAVAAHARAGRRIAVLAPGERPNPAAAWRSAATDSEGYGRALYDHLRRLDEVGADVILVVRPPDGPEWLAIHDRIRRAAARPR